MNFLVAKTATNTNGVPASLGNHASSKCDANFDKIINLGHAIGRPWALVLVGVASPRQHTEIFKWLGCLRACLLEVGGPQVTRLGRVQYVAQYPDTSV